ncbi:ACP S-malonyltransferase [Anaerorhabdus sp.]|uniref:ACP S-malonyltransferase n=1 Tax=Anaerorhabdus sp. TaxID=1872524 RepID=UPI002FCA37E9
MKIAFVFAGQGSQYLGMGKELSTTNQTFKSCFDEINQDGDLAKVCFEDEQRLNQTKDAQWAIYSISMATVKLLEQEGIKPEGCIGLSLGEYSAYACVGAMSIEEGVTLTKKRGALMQDTIEGTNSGMAAILSLDPLLIEEACREASDLGKVSVANYNAPDQIVITGEIPALEKAMDLCSKKGARRAIKLQVSGAFHSELLNPAKKDLREALEKVNWQPCTVPVYSNVSGKVTDSLGESLVNQLVSPVHFIEGIENMIDDGFDTFIEIGPKATCSSFIKKIASKKGVTVTTCNVEDEKSLAKTKETLQGGQA